MVENLSLDELGIVSGTNKTSLLMDYLRHYERIFAPLRHEEMDVIEIGIDQGASLALWSTYFTRARVIGVDIHEICKKHEGGRVVVEIGSAAEPEKIAELTQKYKPKIIIDDGSHIADEVMASFLGLFPTLLPGGYYVIEDVHHHFGELSKTFVRDSEPLPSDYIFSIARDLLALQRDATAPTNGGRPLQGIDSIWMISGAIIVQKQYIGNEAVAFDRWTRAADQAEAGMTWRLFSNQVEESSLSSERKAELFLKCTEKDPDNLYHFYRLSAVLGEMGDLEGAIAAASKALELSTNDEHINASRQRLQHFLVRQSQS